MKIDFNTQILAELVSRQSAQQGELLIKFPKIMDWVNEQDIPTYTQLVKLSEHFNIPFGYFFLDSLPVKKYPIPHYRTIRSQKFIPSTELSDTLEIVEQRREWAREIISEYQTPLYFANSVNLNTPINEAANKIKEVLQLDNNWRTSEKAKNWKETFTFLLKQTEAAGIFVIVNGIVANNTHRQLSINEFRGFVLYDEYSPFIFINGRDFITGKIFTLIHEIAHILIGQSASFDFDKLEPAKNKIEEFCNAVAAEFLVPQTNLLQEVNLGNVDFSRLATKFKVSKIVIARRLLDLDKISKKEFYSAYNRFKISKDEASKNEKSGGNFQNTSPYRISKEFFNLVYSSLKGNKIMYRDAFKLTGLKAGSFDGYVNEYFNSFS